MPTTCPVCNRDDQIQLVSAIVQAGTTSTRYSGTTTTFASVEGTSHVIPGFTSGRTYSSTELAARLAAPNRPSPPGPSCSGMMTIGLVTPILIVPLIMGFFGVTWLKIPILLVMVCAGGLFVVVFLIWIYLLNETFRDDSKAQAKYHTDLQDWQEKYALWSQLYYCHRDGVVFDPQSGKLFQ